jgi:methyl-accepting chemotaxis protein
MNAADRLDSIDARLERLVIVTEQQMRTAERQAQSLSGLRETSERQAETAERQTQSLSELREISERQAETAERQARAIEVMMSAVTQLSRTITSMNQDRNALLESAQRSAQASEAAQMLAQSNQVAIRDLIEELRQGRGA